MTEKVNVYAMDMDICPENDTVITRHQCSGCPHYCGFSLENALPCIKCAYYAHFASKVPPQAK